MLNVGSTFDYLKSSINLKNHELHSFTELEEKNKGTSETLRIAVYSTERKEKIFSLPPPSRTSTLNYLLLLPLVDLINIRTNTYLTI